MNAIPETQNTPAQLDRLAAQRRIYSVAKRYMVALVILTVPVAATWSILALQHPSMKPYAALWGVVVALLDVGLITPKIKDLRKQAALIQELFDCEVLQIDWNEFKVGKKPAAEVIEASARGSKSRTVGCPELRDWYPPAVGRLSIQLARFICQRCSAWWDTTLRRRYALCAALVAAALPLIMLFIGMRSGLTVDKFLLCIVGPMLPVAIWGVREYRENTETIQSLGRLQDHIEKTWAQAVKSGTRKQALDKEARRIQDELFDLRRRSPLIFDWIYRLFRNKDESLMQVGANDLVEQAEAAEKRRIAPE